MAPALLRRALVTLDGPRFRYLVRGHLRVPEGGLLRPLDALHLAVYDWFAHLGVLSDDQQRRVVEGVALLPVLDFLVGEAAAGRPLPLKALTLADGRYAAVSDWEGWYDVETGETVPEPHRRTVTYFLCDLAGLWLRLRERLTELEGGTDAADRGQDGRRVADDDPGDPAVEGVQGGPGG